MITLTLTNNYVIAEGPFSHLQEIHDFLSYNNSISRFEKSANEIYDEDNMDHLERVASETHDEAFQNYLCYKMTGKYHNPYQYDRGNMRQGKFFSKDFMSDGFRSVTSWVGGMRKLKFRSGLLRAAVEFFQRSEIETSIVDNRINVPQLTDNVIYSVGPHTLRDDQKEVIDAVREQISDKENYGHYFTHILLDIAMNTGKTIMAGTLVANIQSPKVLMLFRDVYLCARSVADYIKMGFDVGIIAADKKEIKNVLKAEGVGREPVWGLTDFTIIMVQTLSSKIKRGAITSAVEKHFESQRIYISVDQVVDCVGVPKAFSHSSSVYLKEGSVNPGFDKRRLTGRALRLSNFVRMMCAL